MTEDLTFWQKVFGFLQDLDWGVIAAFFGGGVALWALVRAINAEKRVNKRKANGLNRRAWNTIESLLECLPIYADKTSKFHMEIEGIFHESHYLDKKEERFLNYVHTNLTRLELHIAKQRTTPYPQAAMEGLVKTLKDCKKVLDEYDQKRSSLRRRIRLKLDARHMQQDENREKRRRKREAKNQKQEV